MNTRQHISESRLAEAGTGDVALTLSEAKHTATCTACRELLHRYEKLRERIDELPVVAESSPDLWRRIAADQVTEERNGQAAKQLPPTWRHHSARLAMAAALLVVGFIGGRIDSGSVPVGVDADQSDGPSAWKGSDAALRVQSAGTEYLAALVNLSSAVGDPVVRSQGRDAALAAMYGAALEMADGIRGDDTLRRVALLLQVERARAHADSVAPRDQAER